MTIWSKELNRMNFALYYSVSGRIVFGIFFHNHFFAIFLLYLAKRNCDDCDKYETELFKIRDEIRDSFQTEVAKVIESQLVRLYSPKKEPAVVFFRHGIPLLYDGPINSEEIYQRFDQNRIPAVKELTDESFEHLTQSASGATTGDWFVQLYVSVLSINIIIYFT